MDVNKEVKFLRKLKIKKKSGWGQVGGRGRVGSVWM